MPNIYTPIRIKGISFPNRIVMAPMVRFGFSCQYGVMGERLVQEYLDRADQGIGLLISQVLAVSPAGSAADTAGAYSEKHIDYLRRIADAAHKNGSRFFGQLGLFEYAYHGVSSKNVDLLTIPDLVSIRDSFIRAAEICQKAGLDGIELHGAHTFFLNMMSSSYSNHRQDRYGGDLMGRLTLVREILEGIRHFPGENFIVSYRMGWCRDLDTDVQTALALEKIGVDMLHVSHGIPADRDLNLPKSASFNDIVYTGCHVKQFVHIPVIAVDTIKTLRRGNQLIEEGGCDFAAYGRPFLADGGFVKHAAQNIDYKPCFECRICQWFTDGAKCPAQLLSKRRIETKTGKEP